MFKNHGAKVSNFFQAGNTAFTEHLRTKMSESHCRYTFYLRLKLLATKIHHLQQITKSVFGRLPLYGETFEPPSARPRPSNALLRIINSSNTDTYTIALIYFPGIIQHK